MQTWQPQMSHNDSGLKHTFISGKDAQNWTLVQVFSGSVLLSLLLALLRINTAHTSSRQAQFVFRTLWAFWPVSTPRDHLCLWQENKSSLLHCLHDIYSVILGLAQPSTSSSSKMVALTTPSRPSFKIYTGHWSWTSSEQLTHASGQMRSFSSLISSSLQISGWHICPSTHTYTCTSKQMHIWLSTQQMWVICVVP